MTLARRLLPFLLVLLTLDCLLVARWIQNGLADVGRDYYLYISPRLANPTLQQIAGAEELRRCDVQACIRELSQQPQPQGVLDVGACDVFMYHGSVAVSGFLAFLMIYIAFVSISYVLHQLAPVGARKHVLLACSLAFMFVALPVRPAIWIVNAVVLTFAAARLPMSEKIRSVIVALMAVVLTATIGRQVVAACANEFFTLARIPMHLASLTSAQKSVLAFLQLGAPDAPHAMTIEGFPYVFLGLSFMLRFFRRMLWLAYELWIGRVTRPGAVDFCLYFFGLYALIGNGATPSFREFVDSYGRSPGAVQGGITLIQCVGLGSIFYVTIAMMGYSPATKVLFPRCDLSEIHPLIVWLRIVVVYVVEYLFLLATVQASVGVGRLFGYGLRDNFIVPWMARNVGDFWRRWNIYWREFHLSTSFLPITLRLGRKDGETRSYHLAVASCVTFFITFSLTLLPLLLVHGIAQSAFFNLSSTTPGPGFVRGDGSYGQGLQANWMQIIPPLVVYYSLEAFAVSLSLWAEFRRTRGAKGEARGSLPLPVAIFCTFLVVALLRVFLTDGMTLRDQLSMLGRAFGF